MVATFRPSRRSLLTGALAGGLFAAATASTARATSASDPGRPSGQTTMIGVPFDTYGTVRIGVIGTGNRGRDMAGGWAVVPGAQVVAVCDIRSDRATSAANHVVARNGNNPRPVEYGGSADSYKEMLANTELDLVYIATPWEFHHEQAKASMLAGAHVSVELPIATELEELWDLVDTSEATRRHLFLAENCSYGRNELAMLKMSHEGVFGEVTNGHGGYLHDLRDLLFGNHYTDSWRRLWHTRSTASFYAMHGFAPIAAAMDINRGDRLATLQATATPPRGLADYRERFMPANHPSWDETYINGDLVTCLITTEKGKVIRAEHDVSTPRPYSRINSLAGSRGIFEDYVSGATGGRIYVEPDHGGHSWQDFSGYRNTYDHWLWKKVGDDAAQNGGHGGMDYVMQWRTVQLMRTGQVPDIDVYDSAAWCAPVPLSVASLADGGKPVPVPDFTRGGWKRPRLGLDTVATDMPAVA